MQLRPELLLTVFPLPFCVEDLQVALLRNTVLVRVDIRLRWLSTGQLHGNRDEKVAILSLGCCPRPRSEIQKSTVSFGSA